MSMNQLTSCSLLVLCLDRQALSMAAFVLCFLLPIFMHPGKLSCIFQMPSALAFSLGLFAIKICSSVFVSVMHDRHVTCIAEHASPASLSLSSLQLLCLLSSVYAEQITLHSHQRQRLHRFPQPSLLSCLACYCN